MWRVSADQVIVFLAGLKNKKENKLINIYDIYKTGIKAYYREWLELETMKYPSLFHCWKYCMDCGWVNETAARRCQMAIMPSLTLLSPIYLLGLGWWGNPTDWPKE